MSIRKPLIGFSLFAIVSILVTWVVWTTLQRSVSGSTDNYSATFTSVLGLKPGDDVRIAGVRVGRVDTVELDDQNKATVDFKIENDQHLYTNTKALVRYQNLIGQRYLALNPGQGEAAPLKPGGHIPVQRTEPSFDVSSLLKGFEPLFSVLEPSQVNDLSNTLVQALQGDGVSLSTFVTQAAGLAANFQQKDAILGDVITNLSGVMAGLSQRSGELQTLIAQTRTLVSGLYDQGQTLKSSTEQIAHDSDALVGLVGQIRPGLQHAQSSTLQAFNLLVGNGAALDKTAVEAPPALLALARITNEGAYANSFICSLDVSLWGVLFPRGLFSQIGGNSHSEVCR